MNKLIGAFIMIFILWYLHFDCWKVDELSNQTLVITQSKMKKKQPKIDIIPPFESLAGNWELIHRLESSLARCLESPHLYTNIAPGEEAERLGRGSIEQMMRAAKIVLQAIEALRAEQKNMDYIKLNAQLAHEKLEQHEQLIRNYEKKFSERTKALVDENRMLKEANEKMKRAFNDTEDNYKTLLEQAKEETERLTLRYTDLEAENKKLLMAIDGLQEEVKSQKERNYCLTSLVQRDDRTKTAKEKLSDLQNSKRKYRKMETVTFLQRREGSALEWVSLNDVSALARLLSFLNPREICLVSSLSKQLRLMVLKSKQCVFALGRSILAVQERKVGYYHRHIEYFERLYNRIPDEVIQLAYFRYHILKESVGQEIMAILNRSATIFEGKFTEGEQLYAGISPDPEQELNFRLNLTQGHLLEVDPSIVQDYRTERLKDRQRLMKYFQTMYGKISSTFQLYRADVESSRLFIQNTLKHFARVFVLAKELYLQAHSLQQLNYHLLKELNTWDRMEIDKALQLEDLRAQLEAEKKLKLFFTDKSIKSQQKALIEENMKLTIEMKHNRLTDLMNVTCAEKDELARKNEALLKTNQQLTGQYKESKRRYEAVLQKYNKVTEELAVVKETIIKMNIV